MNIFGRIKNMWKKILSDVPSEVANREDLIDECYQIYKMKAPWLDYTYRTVDGRTRKRRRLSMNPAKVVCRELNGLVFAEAPEITADQPVLDILKANSFIKNLDDLSEYTLALGGGALKLHYDNSVRIDFVKAQNFVPVSWDNNRVTEASFVSHIVKDDKKFMLVETHRKTDEGYRIENAMYDEQNGRKVDLPKGIDTSTDIASTVPLFSYIRPAIANNFDPESPLGVSLFANAIDTIEALDVAFDSLNSELVLGRKRIIVPANSIRSVVNEDGKLVKYFDPTDEVFSALDVDDDQAMKIQDNSVELRVTEIKEAIQVLLDVLSLQVGFSQGYLSFDGAQVKTATEVISDNSRTFKTKKAYENNLGHAVVELMDAIRELMRAYEMGAVSEDEYTIVFDDSVIEDRNSKAAYWQGLYSSGLAPLWKALAHIHGLSEEDAKEMAVELKPAESVDVFGAGV